jgi:hypothetical protein
MYLKDKAEGFVLMGGGGVSSLVPKPYSKACSFRNLIASLIISP